MVIGNGIDTMFMLKVRSVGYQVVTLREVKWYAWWCFLEPVTDDSFEIAYAMFADAV